MSTPILADSPTERAPIAGLSNRLLARRLFDNARLQQDGRHRWRGILALMEGEGDDPAFFDTERIARNRLSLPTGPFIPIGGSPPPVPAGVAGPAASIFAANQQARELAVGGAR